MKQPIPLLLGVLAIYIIGSSLLYANTLCCTGATVGATAPMRKNIAPGTTAPVSTAAAITNTNSILMADESHNFSVASNENLSFKLSEFNYLPISEQLSERFEEVSDYLNEHPDRTLELTGHYQEAETNNSTSSNLGVARANQVRNLLLELEAPAHQLITTEAIATAVPTEENVLTNVISYRFIETPQEEVEDLSLLAERLRNTPIRLYFDTNAKKIELTPTQSQYITDLLTYLNEQEDAIVQVSGHTDNEGDPAMNRYISRKRAHFVRDYLIRNGMKANQIKAVPEGPDRPLASNETEAGRAKNRRVEITLK